MLFVFCVVLVLMPAARRAKPLPALPPRGRLQPAPAA
jgi:hypothetical protein